MTRAGMWLCGAGIALASGFGCTAGPIDVVSLPPEVTFSDLLAHWRLDDATGAAARDNSGNLREGTVSGGIWTGGHFGGGLRFPASGGQVAVPSFPNATTTWSVSLWVNIAAADFGPQYATLISTEIPNQGGWEVNALLEATNPHFEFGYWVGPGQGSPFYDLATCACIEPGQWTHLAGVLDGNKGTLTLYVNGAQASEVAIRGLISQGAPTLYMGRWGDSADPRYFTGIIDDVAIYGRALVPQEVALLAAAPAPDPRRS